MPSHAHIDDFNSASLAELSPSEAVKVFRMLLWCSARRRAVPVTSITITAKVDVPDGGVDAEVARNGVSVDGDLLVAGNSFFQIKTGTSAVPWQQRWVHRELFCGAAKPTKAALGKAVRHCLSHGGRYVLVCFGCDPTGLQRRTAIRNLQDGFKACGYRHPRVDVWGQSTIAGLIQTFPSIVLRLTDRQHLPFLTYDDWRLDPGMGKELHVGKGQEQMIVKIRECLRGSKVHHVRLIGEPGLGKTRLALEAISAEDLASTVVYVRHPEDFQRSPLFNSIVRSDDTSLATIVIDDCPERERASIWHALRQRSDRLRLITLDHGPERSADDLMQVIECPPLEPDQVKAIIKGYIGKDHDLSRWADFCSGSPRVAHAVGDNLAHNRDDILKPPASVHIWDRFVHGSSTTGSPEETRRECVLRHIALFHRFGFEHPVEEEAKFIASLVQLADPDVTWPRFQEIVTHYRDRRILQGKTTLFLVPRALHIHLWIQFWENYGRNMDVAELISRMPQSLFRWFVEMFKYGHASQSCTQQIERLTSRGGPFDKPEFITEGQGAAFLNELAEAHPEATLRCIERIIGGWSHEELLRFDQRRQYLVWALEKIAIWKDLFRRAASLLLRLASAENAMNSNNATGTFCELFGMGFGRFASSEAPPATRLPVLRDALASPDAATRSVSLKAAAKALAGHPQVKMVGPEHQGIRPLPSLWLPKTWGEVYEGYQAAWQLVAESRRNAKGDERTQATKILVEAAFGLIQNRWMEDEVLATFQELLNDSENTLREIVHFVARHRMINWKGLSRKAANALRAIDNSIRGTTTESQIKRLVLLGTWDDINHRKGGPYGEEHFQNLRRLAGAAMSEPSVIQSLLPALSSAKDGFMIGAFGRAFGEQDQQLHWWPAVLQGFEAAGDRRNPEFAAGYLSAVFSNDRANWERIALELLCDTVLRGYARALVLASGLTEVVLDEMCAAVDRGEVLPSAVRGLAYARKSSGISTDRCVRFLSWCLRNGAPDLAGIALETAYGLFCHEKDAPQPPEDPLLDVLTASQLFEVKTWRELHYEWAELAKQYVSSYPQHAMRILESVLSRFDDSSFVSALRHSVAQQVVLDLMRSDSKATWAIIAARLTPMDGLAWHLADWLAPPFESGPAGTSCPLSAFAIDDILKWVAADPNQRAPFIARCCPKTLSLSEGGALTRELLIRYGDVQGVHGALLANFGTESIWGNASEYHRKKRDKAREWLSAETARPVIDWLEQYIDILGHDIRREEIEEERRF